MTLARRYAQGVEKAGAVLGWKVRVIDGRGDPGAWNGAILSAIAAKSDGIVLAAVPPLLVGDALKRAQDAHIPVVSVFNPKPTVDDGIVAFVRPDHVAQGQLAAQWVAADSGGKAKVLLVEDKEFAELNQRVEGFKTGLAACSGLLNRRHGRIHHWHDGAAFAERGLLGLQPLPRRDLRGGAIRLQRLLCRGRRSAVRADRRCQGHRLRGRSARRSRVSAAVPRP